MENKEKDYYGLIYKIINMYNHKIYIGQTTRTLKRMNCYWGGGTLIKKKIQQYGKKLFKQEILGFCDNQKELDRSEKVCIRFFKSYDDKYGYNIELGGKAGFYKSYINQKIYNLKG